MDENPEISIGRIVHYVLDSGPFEGQHRPAIVVMDFGGGCVNLQVFTDSNEQGKFNDELPPVMWKTSILEEPGGAMGTWHWPERV